ncbi:hypothetical protein BHU72_01840 [Desulfuribacillus stibiiarsenatis]|uniref:Cytochrome c-552/DMSO reductase-like haem-binding domain-containing protein n=1 Tax=Desulfuribacillus stibiiarsenatis TaxID=1390249 RepID=A0A1E5LA65_9FIRM|nr:ethylbenzene dehydrogenase-related protein [Desulfuribacillus stibiiarsenatis]OEH87020.1 hypothetical protein BHU72_01840 [Desulfuribacillus stibiiarsenatis]
MGIYRIKHLFLCCFVILIIVIAGCGLQADKVPPVDQPNEDEIPENTLVAIKANKAPTIDGVSENVWDQAPEFQVSLSGGAMLQGGTGGKFDDGNTEVGIKALYDNQNIYMQFVWEDSTESLARGPWIKENGKLVLKPYNEYYEDKFAVLWNINDSVAGFNEQGCGVTCHTTEFKAENGSPIIKHYTNAENEILDMWHWKSVRQNTVFGPDKPGLMHDQQMVNTRFNPEDPATKGAGRKADPGEKEYKVNATEDKSQPLYVFDGEVKNGNPYVIVEGIDNRKEYTSAYLAQMKEGDFIPGAISFQITGDPADIAAKAKWENGVWTMEIQRKLVTNSDKDIAFNDLNKEYFFSVAAFDNSQIGHAFQAGVQKLIFRQ